MSSDSVKSSTHCFHSSRKSVVVEFDVVVSAMVVVVMAVVVMAVVVVVTAVVVVNVVVVVVVVVVPSTDTYTTTISRRQHDRVTKCIRWSSSCDRIFCREAEL